MSSTHALVIQGRTDSEARQPRQRRLTEKQQQQVEEQAAAAQRRAQNTERRELAKDSGSRQKQRKAPPVPHDATMSRRLLPAFSNLIQQHKQVPPQPLQPQGRASAQRSRFERDVYEDSYPSEEDIVVPRKSAPRLRHRVTSDEDEDDNNVEHRPRRLSNGGQGFVDDDHSDAIIEDDGDIDVEDIAEEPVTGEKRRHDDNNNSNHDDNHTGDETDIDHRVPRKPKRVRRDAAEGSRVRAKDFDAETREVIALAATLYRVKISTINAFPSHSQEDAWAHECWQAACEQTELNVCLTEGTSKLLTCRGSQIRGEIKSRVRAHVKTLYKFKSGEREKVIRRNRARAEDLTADKGYLYRKFKKTKREGLYKHEIIQEIVNEQYFSNRKDEGVIYYDAFRPFPIEALALIFTAIECGIDEWKTGTREDITFSEQAYASVYRDHVTSLNDFDERTRQPHDILGKLGKKLYDIGRSHSGAGAITQERKNFLTDADVAAAVAEHEAGSTTESESDSDEEMGSAVGQN